MAKPTFIGLDIETSASNLLGKTIQIGIARGTESSFVSDIGWSTVEFHETARLEEGDEIERGLVLIETEALKVNRFDIARIRAGRPAWQIDSEAAEWISQWGKGLHCVGWNVGSFDMPFVRRDLPNLAKHLSRRTVDLNALCFALGSQSQLFDERAPGWEFFKKRSKRYAEEILGHTQWHDAGYDAKAALLSFRWLSDQMGKSRID